MKLSALITMLVLFAGLVSAQVDTRLPLPNAHSTNNGTTFPTTPNKSWVKDTLALRALCDSNGYRGSCLPLIASFVTNANGIVDPSGTWSYRVSQLRFTNLTWLKKITKNIDSLIYLSTISISGCTNLTYITGLNRYVQAIAINNAPIDTFNFSFNYLKIINISNCKNLKNFPYRLPSPSGVNLRDNSINDLTGFSIGDFVYDIRVSFRNNKLTTLPAQLLQKLLSNNDSIDVDGNCICSAQPNIITLLDQIATDRNWRATQICTQVSVSNKKNPVKNLQKKNEDKTVDLKGRLLKKNLSKFNITKNNIRL